MATSIRLLRRYVWLVDTIRRAGSLSLEDINRKWALNTSLNVDSDDEIPERTFHRHREAIAELFGIDIRCNRFDGNRYYIENEESLSTPSFTTWLFNGLSIDNQMLDNREASQRIVFEEAVQGNEYLSPIISALCSNRVVSVVYRRFNVSEAKEWSVEPVLLKESKRRWYLVGKITDWDNGTDRPGLRDSSNLTDSGSFTVLAFDRIQELKILDQSFTPEEVDRIKSRFNEIIGVNFDEDYSCEEVVIRVYGRQRAYFEALPLHPSQRLLRHTQEYSDYSLTLRAEYEFQREVLRLGPDAEILSPPWLREEIKWLSEETLRLYTKP